MAHRFFEEHDSHTLGEFVSAVLSIHTPAEAEEFFKSYCDWLSKRIDMQTRAPIADLGEAVIEDIAKDNIGWVYGEGMKPIDVHMWTTTTGARHPVMGSRVLTATPEEWFEAGFHWMKEEE